MRLSCLNNSVGSREVKPTAQDSAETVRVSSIRRLFGRGTLSLEAEWGKELAIGSFKALLVLPDVKASHEP